MLRVWWRDMAVPTPEKVTDTYRKVTVFYADLVALAAKYEKAQDKSLCALEAVNATIAFLKLLRVSESLLGAFVEARNAIQRDRNAETSFEQRQTYDIWDSGVVSLLHEQEGLTLDEAGKKIHEHDPVEAKRLLEFRKNIKKGKTAGPKKARQQYYQFKNEFKRRFPENTAARALRASKAMKGKKG
jgi:hypothetical protein